MRSMSTPVQSTRGCCTGSDFGSRPKISRSMLAPFESAGARVSLLGSPVGTPQDVGAGGAARLIIIGRSHVNTQRLPGAALLLIQVFKRHGNLRSVSFRALHANGAHAGRQFV